jgi:hypothetical protein
MGLFGRGKDSKAEPACAGCGRTLLAGEWTQRLLDEDGNESLVCSLCSQDHTAGRGEPLAVTTGSSNATRLKESRSDSDAFWRALKEKDARIGELESRLARAEAERQELTARMAQLQRQVNGEAPFDGTLTPDVPAPPPAAEAAMASPLVADEFVPFAPAPTMSAAGETAPAAREAAESEASLTGGIHPYDALGEPAAEAPDAHPYRVLEPDVIEHDDLGATMPGIGQAFIDQPIDDPARTMPGEPDLSPEAEAADEQPLEPTAAFANPAAPIMQSRGLAAGGGGSSDAAAPTADDDDQGATMSSSSADMAALTMLQRGVDLLNVSPVPKKIAETNEHLGIPSVHVGFLDDKLMVTFLWSMGWYRYEVDVEGGGTVRLGDRGYEDRADLTPNAAVRSDGTVQLAPARITRPTARPDATPDPAKAAPAPTEAERTYGDPAPTVNRGDIISKSLAGKRTDDEDAAVGTWERQQAREFNWDR